MKRIEARSVVCTIITLSIATGCASPGKRTAIGAGAGAGAGALVGGLAGGWKGAGIGAAIGALSGGAVGNYLDKQANELAQVAETHRTAEGILVNLKNDLLFDTGSAVLKDGAIAEVAKLGDILKAYPEDRIRIGGHTDNVGKLSSNESLSLRRAEAVRSVLMSRGVKDTQMLVQGFGPAKPVSSNTNQTGRAKNRRVELYIDVPNSA